MADQDIRAASLEYHRQSPPGKIALRVAIAGAVAFVGVAIVAIGGATGLAWTSTQKFCISCHEMRDNVYAEFQDTIHDKNRVGVHVVCSDCHVPHAPGPLIWRKINATFEIWGALLSGACVVGIPREVSLVPRDLGVALREEGVTTLFLTTALFGLEQAGVLHGDGGLIGK